jgi:hypothetical protein
MTGFWQSGLKVITAVFVFQLYVLSSYAQSRSAQIEALKRQMEEIQRQNQRQIEELRNKIEELETKKEADQKRIEELAVKEEEKDAWWRKVDAGIKDGLFFKTKDGNFSIKMNLYGQVQFSINDTDDKNTATDFNIRRLRLIWSGNAFRPWLLYYTQLEATDDVVLRDAFFDVAYDTRFAPRVGQFKVPFNREQLYSGSALQLIERSILDDEFRFARDEGAAIYGALGNYIVYGAGVFNGDGRNGTSVDSNLLYAGRIQFTPCCGELKYKQGQFPTGGDYNFEPNFGPKDNVLVAISAAAAVIPGLNIERKTPDNSSIDDRFAEIGTVYADVFSFTTDVNLRYSVFSLDGEYIFRRISPEESDLSNVNDQGFRVQGGFFVIPRFIEVAGRFTYIDFDDDVDEKDKKWEITPGLGFYFSKSHKWKLQFGYSFIREEDTAGEETDSNTFRTQIQVYF